MRPPRPDGQPSGMVTFLFTDIEGSTRRWEQHPEAMHAALARHDAVLRRACEPRGGYVFHTAGDAFFVAFADAGAALGAAVEAQRQLIDTEWDEAGPLRVRMAIHTGEPLQRAGDYFGPAVNRCARLVAAAHGDQIVLSEATVDRLPRPLSDGITLRDLGHHRLRDLNRPEHVFQVVHPALPADFPRLRSLDSLPNNLPIQLTSFVGRRRDLATVRNLSRDHRLVTLIGPGGCGKTRLALQAAADVAKHYRDGAWLVELAAVADPVRVPQAVALAIGAREGGRPRPREGDPTGTRAAAASETWLGRVVAHLQSRDLLLVLDNCEHVVDACARLVAMVLQRCPAVRVIATSREALGVPGEVAWPVPSMSHPDAAHVEDVDDLIRYEAVRLFIDRARAIEPGFRLDDDNAAAVAQIARRLDGIPLAIELAAARLRVLSPAEIAARLDDRFRLLTGGHRTALPRHQTLEAALDWSHDLLAADERTLFRRLSVFGGGFSLDAAEAVCADAERGGGSARAWIDLPDGERAAVLDVLSQLVDKSLVRVDDAAGATRYVLLETIRQYGAAKLVAAAEAARFRRRHRDWFLGLAEDAARDLAGPSQDAALDRLALELDNVRTALGWSIEARDGEAALRLAGAVWWLWFVRGGLGEGRDWLDRALALGAEAPDGLRARVLLGAGALAWRQRDYGAAAEELTAALALYRRLDDRGGVAQSLHFLGRVAHFQGDHTRAWVLYEESLAHAEAQADTRGVAATLDVMGLLAWQQGEYGAATAYLQSSLAHGRDLGDLRGIAASLNILGRMAVDQGEYARARSLLAESTDVYTALGDEVSIVYGDIKRGQIALHEGDLPRAERELVASRDRCRDLGERRGQAYAAVALAEVKRAQGDLAAALRLAAEGLALAREVADKRGIADALAAQGRVAWAAGEPAPAAARLVEALDLYAAMGDRLGAADGYIALAHVLAAGDPAGAARLVAASTAIRARIGARVPPARVIEDAQLLEAVRAALDPAAFDDAWAAGTALDVAEAVEGAR